MNIHRRLQAGSTGNRRATGLSLWFLDHPGHTWISGPSPSTYSPLPWNTLPTYSFSTFSPLLKSHPLTEIFPKISTSLLQHFPLYHPCFIYPPYHYLVYHIYLPISIMRLISSTTIWTPWARIFVCFVHCSTQGPRYTSNKYFLNEKTNPSLGHLNQPGQEA